MSPASSIAVSPSRDWRSGTVEISGGRLAYHRTGGDGPPLVLSHGLTDNGLCWSRVAQALSSTYDVVMLDARGHGASSRMVSGLEHDAGRDLAEAIAGLGLTQPIVVGHSVGASATAAFANSNPGAAAMVILEDPPFLAEIDPAETEQRREAFRRQLAAMQASSDEEIVAAGKQTSPLWDEAEFPAWAQGKRQVDPEAFPARFPPWRSAIDRIAAPCLLLYGEAERGGLVTPQVARVAMRLNPRIAAVQIKDAGHNIRRENFAGFMAAVRAFLSNEIKTGNRVSKPV